MVGCQQVAVWGDWVAVRVHSDRNEHRLLHPRGRLLHGLHRDRSRKPTQGATNLFTESCQLFIEACQSFTESCQLFTESCQLFTESCQLFTESGQLFTESGHLFNESGQLFTESCQLFTESGQLFTESYYYSIVMILLRLSYGGTITGARPIIRRSFIVIFPTGIIVDVSAILSESVRNFLLSVFCAIGRHP
jgi:hypothetical protein